VAREELPLTSNDALPAIPGYTALRALARGGMAVVYAAREERTGKTVAVKRIRPDVAEDEGFIDRFRHEVQIHSGLDHPNILALTDFGVGPDTFIVMELVDGGTLRTLLDRVRRLPPELALFVAAEICRGLGHAHGRGVVHRDVKPQNILISLGGAIKVADFGISRTTEMTRLTQTGSVIGTPSYMSPEQAMARPMDGRSDLFSTGVLLREMITGENPFQTDNPATTLRRVVEHVPPPLMEVDPTIPFTCERTVGRLLAKAPPARFQTAEEAITALDQAREELGLRQPAEAFRSFLARPDAAWTERNRRLARGHLHQARTLWESGSASPEAVLWEALQASLLDPADSEASDFVKSVSSTTGYRLDAAARQRTLDLEARLRMEPDDVALELQVAKSAKIDRDFLRMMRSFLRLREATVDDPYLRGQIASIVSRPAPVEPAEQEATRQIPGAPAPRSSPRSARPVLPSPPVASPPSARKVAGAAALVAAAAALVTAAAWWVFR
jgi:serine/threonine protein kinase